MNGSIRRNPNKNLKKPAVNTLISAREIFNKTFIVTPDTEATKANRIALTLFVIIYLLNKWKVASFSSIIFIFYVNIYFFFIKKVRFIYHCNTNYFFESW